MFVRSICTYDADHYFMHTHWYTRKVAEDFAEAEANAVKFMASPYWPKWRDAPISHFGPFQARTEKVLP